MEKNKSYESFPLGIILLSDFISLSIYAIGIYIFSLWGIVPVVLYVVYCLWLERRLLKEGCRDCSYYGRFCGFGKGKLCALFFRKGDIRRFKEKEISFRDIIPDFLVSFFPLTAGLVFIIKDFNWVLLFLIIVLIILSTAGSAVIRGNFTCKYCRQREIGCPAERLFNKRDGQD